MSVNHFLLPITDDELRSLLDRPESVRPLVEQHKANTVRLDQFAPTITAIIASDSEDPLALLHSVQRGAGGLIGPSVDRDGQKVAIDMGYGPPWYVRNESLREAAQSLQEIDAASFADALDADELEEHSVYPGGWRNPGRLDETVKRFCAFKQCVEQAAANGRHLLIWCA